MRDTYVSEDTQIQVTNVYRRNKTKRDKLKRNFNFVLKGMMLSSVLVSSVIAGFGGNSIAKADGFDSQNPPDPNQTPPGVEDVQGVHQDEQARILNLKNANRVLDAAIKSGQLDSWVYERLMKSLVAIDGKLDIDKKFDLSSELIDEMMKSEVLLSAETAKALGVDAETDRMRNIAYDTLQDVRGKLKGLTPLVEVEVDLDTGSVASQELQPTATAISTVKVASTDAPQVVSVASRPSTIYKPNADGTWTAETDPGVKPTTKTETPKTTQTVKAPNKTIYSDFDSSQYWSNDMIWLIDKGYITGYINQKHPTTGKHGTWLNPNGKLTESQMLSVLLRYNLGLDGYAKMNKDIPNPKNNWSYNHYVTADKIGMMTKGSPKDGSYATKQVTRGQLAQALVSMHYGQDVTLSEAVQFMFDNKLTSGTVASNGATMANFAPESKLSRAHISAFVKRFHDVKASGSIKEIPRLAGKEPVKNPPVTPKPSDSVSDNNGKDKNIYSLVPKTTKTPDVVGSKITTKFGERAYGAKNQAEYDATMKIVEKEMKDGELKFEGLRTFKDIELQAVQDYFFNGKTAIKDKKNPDYRTSSNQLLLGVEKSYGAFKDKVSTIEDIQTIMSITDLQARPSTVHANHALDNSTIDAVSAYDLVVRGLLDCDSEAYYNSAVFDQLGVETFVIESPTRVHTFVAFKLFDEWFVYDTQATSGYLKLTPDFIKPADRISYAPNGGTESLPTFLQKIYNPKN